jgi:hypothetical protein
LICANYRLRSPRNDLTGVHVVLAVDGVKWEPWDKRILRMPVYERY